ncbi:uncharacterized protein LOC127811662 isoform X2 [Diospyros lotus]|uniref:uncharacterized protein LOC127811662 isoform X2 n=1 Tax=Diospyros lotus TaxID=55363 RepID=UPI0022582D44|nr:uncharacterized protein LOC127811662 isoform X2 [Diospyros lotus]
MGCRNREFLGQESDALLFATMCIIGLPVDVHVKDGAIYSGVFHTACVEDDYSIVLKEARMTKKGNSDANVASGELIETLVVQSEDLVQVVAKGILLPADGITCSVAGHDGMDIPSTVPSLECAGREEKLKQSNNNNMDRKQTSRTRRQPQIENGIAQGFTHTTKRNPGNSLSVENGTSVGVHSMKMDVASSAAVNGREARDGRSQEKQFHYQQKSNFQKEESTREAQGSVPSYACSAQSIAVEEIERDTSSKQLQSGAPSERPAPVIKLKDQGGTAESCVNLSIPNGMAPPKSSSLTSKEFKLNPGAKVFCPSFANHRSVTPPAVPAVANVTYIPDNFPVVPIASPQPEADISSFVPRSSLPVKFVPYGNLMAGNGDSDSQYPQPVIGHVGDRTQLATYAGHHHPIQAGPTYMHPNFQNVMVGRSGQLVYMHPVSHHVNQGVSAFSQVSTRPLLTSHQGHLPKHQGTPAPQALQLCVTPSFIAGGQQQFTVQNHFPLPQPPVPVIRHIPVPGSNGIFGTKFP